MDKAVDIPAQIFAQFLSELEKAGEPKERIDRLRQTLIQERTLNESQVKAAIFGQETVNDPC